MTTQKTAADYVEMIVGKCVPPYAPFGGLDAKDIIQQAMTAARKQALEDARKVTVSVPETMTHWPKHPDIAGAISYRSL